MLTRQEIKEKAKIILQGEYSNYWIFIFLEFINWFFSALIAMISFGGFEIGVKGIGEVLSSKPTLGAILLRVCICQFFSTLIGLNFYRRCYDKIGLFSERQQIRKKSKITLQDAIYCCIFMTFLAVLMELMAYPYANFDIVSKMSYGTLLVYGILVLLIVTLIGYYSEILAIVFSFNPQKGLAGGIGNAIECFFANFWSIVTFNISFWGWWIIPWIIWGIFRIWNNIMSNTYAEYLCYGLFSVIMFGIALFYSPYREMSVVIFVNQMLRKNSNTIEEKKTTVTFYNQNAIDFFDGTISADMSDMHHFFLKHLSSNANILDFGCGSGRDSKAFKEAGYTVEAIDGSEELCKLAAEYAGIPVKHMYFQDLQEKNRYDGIWACASILHLTWEELKDVIPKMTDALKENGVIYASFKYGDFEGEKNGRYFTYLTEERLERLLKEIAVETLNVSELLIGETVKTADVRKDREEELWLNVILQKVSRNQK